MTVPASIMSARRVAAPADPAALAVLSDRDERLPGGGNVSLTVGGARPQATRATLLGALGLAPGDAVFMEQVHGSGVAAVGRGDRGRGVGSHADAIKGVDGLVTWDTDVALAVMVADCVPVLLVDPGRSVAAAHAGRRGVQADVVGTVVERMAPADPTAVHALIGPAIGGCCYEVPDALADEVAARSPAADTRTSWGTRGLDLPAAVAARLRALGVSAITSLDACTRCGPGNWFSHRANPGAGRQAAIVCRRSQPPENPNGGTAQPRAVAPGRILDWSA